MDLIVTHNNADFDALGAAVAAHKLYPNSRILLPGSQEQAVRKFLSLAKDKIRIETEKSCDFSNVTRLVLVDTRHRFRIGRAQELLSNDIEVHIYDHHPRMSDDIKGDVDVFEEVGATVTLLLNILRKKKGFRMSPLEATIMLLGIYEETGSITYRSTTRADVDVVSYLLGQGANLQAVSSYLNRQLSEAELAFLVELINKTRTYVINGVNVAISQAEVTEFIGELGTIVHKLDEVENFPVLFVLFKTGKKIRVLARSRESRVNVNKILRKLGGGGHKTAATAKVDTCDIEGLKENILKLLKTMIRVKVYAKDIMTSPVRTLSVDKTIKEAGGIFKKLRIKGMPCVRARKIVGMITVRDLGKAIRHNFGHSKITGYMRTKVVTIGENTPLHVIQRIMFERDIGRIPVVKNGKLTGIVTRTDVLKRVHSDLFKNSIPGYVRKRQGAVKQKVMLNLYSRMKAVLPGTILGLLKAIGKMAEANGYSSFVVGGFVRDVLLGSKNFDVDIVVEGNALEFGSVLAKKLKGTLVVHRKFGTATVITDWPKGVKRPALAGAKFKIDLATARKEKYEKPAALPTVEFSSLKDDLSRRDFSVNAMAASLNSKTFGQLIDFFNGLADLKNKRIRVLHEASFVDDPTRIFRAVRFEQRFSFKIDPYTEKLIQSAVKEKMFKKTENQRIRDELILILKEKDPVKALRRMQELHELRFIHRGIVLRKNAEKLFKACGDIHSWFVKAYPRKRYIDLYLMYLIVLTENLGLKEIKELCAKFSFRRSDRIRLISYKKNSGDIIRMLSSSKDILASDIYKILEPVSYEEILVILAKTDKSKIKRRIFDFLRKYNGMSIKIRGGDLKKIGMTEGPRFREILTAILYAKLDGKIRTKKEELSYVKRIIKGL